MAEEVKPDETPESLFVRLKDKLAKTAIVLAYGLVLTAILTAASFATNWLSQQTGIQPSPTTNVTNDVKPSEVVVIQNPLFGQPAPVMAAGDPAPGPMGWVDKPDEVKAVMLTLPQPVFASTPAGQTEESLPKFVYLWDAYRKQYGRPPPPQNQNPVGSCVGFGTSRAMERSLINQVVNGDRYEFKPFTEEAIYAISRVQIGGGRIRGSDGSVGAWAAKAATEYGGLPRGQYGNWNLTTYSPSRCREWGDKGLPAELLAEAKKYPTGATSQVRTWEEAKKAIAQSYGIAVCSNQGFTSRRDSRGVCQPSGQWMHCMVLDGYHTDENDNEWGHIGNSWGADYHTGPVGWGEPNTAGFWTDSATINRMLGQGDSWAFSAVKGFPRRKISWFANARPSRVEFGRETLYALAP